MMPEGFQTEYRKTKGMAGSNLPNEEEVLTVYAGINGLFGLRAAADNALRVNQAESAIDPLTPPIQTDIDLAEAITNQLLKTAYAGEFDEPQAEAPISAKVRTKGAPRGIRLESALQTNLSTAVTISGALAARLDMLGLPVALLGSGQTITTLERLANCDAGIFRTAVAQSMLLDAPGSEMSALFDPLTTLQRGLNFDAEAGITIKARGVFENAVRVSNPIGARLAAEAFDEIMANTFEDVVARLYEKHLAPRPQGNDDNGATSASPLLSTRTRSRGLRPETRTIVPYDENNALPITAYRPLTPDEVISLTRRIIAGQSIFEGTETWSGMFAELLLNMNGRSEQLATSLVDKWLDDPFTSQYDFAGFFRDLFDYAQNVSRLCAAAPEALYGMPSKELFLSRINTHRDPTKTDRLYDHLVSTGFLQGEHSSGEEQPTLDRGHNSLIGFAIDHYQELIVSSRQFLTREGAIQERLAAFGYLPLDLPSSLVFVEAIGCPAKPIGLIAASVKVFSQVLSRLRADKVWVSSLIDPITYFDDLVLEETEDE